MLAIRGVILTRVPPQGEDRTRMFGANGDGKTNSVLGPSASGAGRTVRLRWPGREGGTLGVQKLATWRDWQRSVAEGNRR